MMDPVPWLVGGGAQHSPEVARLLAFAATGGAEGVVNVSDLKVMPLSVPGTAVEALPGAALVRNRGAGGDSQTYVARNVTATQVEIVATGSSGGRSDLIVVQVEDPNVAGEPWQSPPDPAVGPYVFVRVIPNVPAGTTRLQDVPGYEGRSAVTLARVDLPASTGTVTAEMITDLRKVAVPRIVQRMFVYDPPNDRHMVAGSTDWQPWPLVGDGQGRFGQVDVPEWATRARVLVSYTGMAARRNSWGSLRMLMGDSPQVSVQGMWDSTVYATDDPFTFVAQVAGEVAVPAGLRGVTAQMRLQAALGSSSIASNAVPWTTGSSRVVVQVEFEEAAV